MKSNSAATSPKEYIASVPAGRRPIVEALDELIRQTVPSLEPFVHAGMLGYGRYHYTYASGREGDWSLVALANQKNYVSLYLCAADDKGYLAETNKDRLGKVSVGRSCIRFKKVEDLNLDVVKELLKKTAKLGSSGSFKL
jgi:hypothetical protein